MRPIHNRALETFTRSAEGRRFNNGASLRTGHFLGERVINNYYFGGSHCFYPFYTSSWNVSLCYYSPYSYYYDACPPFIFRRNCFYFPPPLIWVEVPLYRDNFYVGYGYGGDYYLSRDNRYDEAEIRSAGLDNALDDLRTSFRTGNITSLAQLVDPNVKIAVFRTGKYEYSLPSNDYLDMTRDMLRTCETVQFDITRVRKRADGVYVASGKHVYVGQDSEKRTVYTSFVLEKIGGRWTITQIGTAPNNIVEPR